MWLWFDSTRWCISSWNRKSERHRFRRNTLWRWRWFFDTQTPTIATPPSTNQWLERSRYAYSKTRLRGGGTYPHISRKNFAEWAAIIFLFVPLKNGFWASENLPFIIKDDFPSCRRPHQGVDEDLGSFLALVQRVDVGQLLQQVHHGDGDMCSALRRRTTGFCTELTANTYLLIWREV